MKQIRRFLTTYATLLVLFVLQKPLFILATHSASKITWGEAFAQMPAVMWHGLSLDAAMAAYLSLVPGLLLLAGVWVREEVVRPVLSVYHAFVACVMSLCFILNIALYPYWNSPLDTTPFYYFLSSPADAFASVSLWVALLGLVVTLLVALAMWLCLRPGKARADRRYGYTRTRSSQLDRHRVRTSFILLLLTLSLIIPIRGGFSVSTNNTGKAYFSQVSYLNHAAVNPLFSLFEGIDHQENFGQQYRYLSDAEATTIFKEMVNTGDANTYPLLDAHTFGKGSPDILIVIMEGFASDMMPSLGTRKDVAVQLDSIASQGILFTRFYANSFRTDRGLTAILSGFPAQPCTSIMRYPAKAAKLPSLARALMEARHYHTAYYYGGDVDFAFQRSYLVSQGYEKIVSEEDFPANQRKSKWGVPDHLLAQRLLRDIKSGADRGPMLRVMQTSSSHEPFDVPYSRLKDKRLNAFAYTDSVVGSVVRQLRSMPRWKNTLVVLVPDHVGDYMEGLSFEERSRYQIPLVLTGGVIEKPLRVGIIGSQQDIAATLLGQLGIAHSDFLFSKNMLSDATPKFAFFAVPDLFGVVSEENSVIFDNKSRKAVYDKGPKPGFNIKRGQAYLQKLFDDIDRK